MVLVATVVVVFLIRRPGHWWGDDWALYVRQAESIFSGGVGDVVADNRFTVERSGLPEFSPPMYPWGFPLLLSPFVAVLGTDLDFGADSPDCPGDRCARDRVQHCDGGITGEDADGSASCGRPEVGPDDVVASYHAGAVRAARRRADCTSAGSGG